MRKRIACVTAAILSISLGVSGCGLIPFEQDIPFLSSRAENAETEKKTEQQTIDEQDADTEKSTEDTQQDDGLNEGEQTDNEDTEEADEKQENPMEQAALMAVQYDYDGAIELLKSQPDYESNTDMQSAVSDYENTKATCTEYPLEQITHVFFHTLIKDTARAFDGDSDSNGYNQYMTTIDEFNKIIQSMYDKGYVMVSPHDMAVINMDGDGFASKLVVDSNGEVKNEYIEDDGSVSTGDYDMVPLIDTFVKEHPDFSYHGRKGILAMTGYDGVLGYRTDIAYKTGKKLQDDQKKFLEDHPDFNYKQEVKNAKKVAKAMKAEGWEFASHTWGHQNVGQVTLEKLQADTERFKKNVDPLIGGTDVIIFAFGTDITNDQEYSGDKFEYLKGQGYNYYCNVDSSQYYVQIRDRYFRQGRRNLDGYRMYYNPELLSDLFDVKDVFDPARPTPVPPM